MSRPTYVYIIVSGEFIKVGIAVDPAKRVKGVRTGSPEGATLYNTKLFPSLKAARYAEKRMHRQLWKVRQSGEWFRYSPRGAMVMLGKIKAPPNEILEANGGYGWREPTDEDVDRSIRSVFESGLRF